jgi:RNA polymerase sigma factor (sigma-70 family)
MDFITAIDWVRNNEDKIRRKIENYRIFSPYEELDYLQEAYLSAFVAVQRSNGKGIPFVSAFWTIFKERIGKMTPNPGNRSGSNSIPSHLCDFGIESIDVAQGEQLRAPDIEMIFNKVCRYLTTREQRVLCLALGITYEGHLSNYEIAYHLGCRESNVRDALNKAFGRIRDLVRMGRINPEELRRRDEGDPE